ncbi:uncharacterized protein E0L32_006581 [Thyridium curvatum]|uniref:Xylanolytic transcriptional activator regulatory domain-containing protein n=1 Tax=Thyridium curvatum TaxID=1093900 RepID=A0A507B1K9_9PEZI|nr:uncharacterized protein E0L32_006581 [Thyridium curvatum]TPX12936.1 hypothetical protein E0L32_006581 [Thyridium curvatum]
MTDPSADSMSQAFQSSSYRLSSIGLGSYSEYRDENLAFDLSSLGLVQYSTSIVSDHSTFVFDEHQSHDQGLNSILEEICLAFKSLHENLQLNDSSYTEPFDIEFARSVFTVKNARTFLSAYFTQTYAEFPLVHGPTFAIHTAPKSLLLALMLSGALRSPPQDDTFAIRGFFYISEEYIFGHLKATLQERGPLEITNDLLQALVATQQMMIVQSMMNERRTRRRLLSQRLPILVSVVRELGLARVRHPSGRPAGSWHEFIHRESCIRVGCWTALATWNVCLMLNMPGPLITPSELTCNLQCAPELWDAKDEEAFHVACDDLEFHHSLESASPAYLVSTLMGEEWPGPTGAPFKHVPLSGLQQSLMGEFAARQNFSFAYDSLFLPSLDHDDYLSATHVSLVLFCPSSTPRHLAMARSLETGN